MGLLTDIVHIIVCLFASYLCYETIVNDRKKWKRIEAERKEFEEQCYALIVKKGLEKKTHDR